ncbi:M12 family metallo-peptidase [Sodalis glossinidius]|uniref:M12 family metallo-peptidase n=1 Tax=Sodalis glossinidius TaxID=63612 RepID=UPI000682C052|nr:M12 family metallo-peptidase [Sodalis glossinidius]
MQKKSITITPNELKNGKLPSGYDEVIFKLSDGNWTKNITLPLQPDNNNRVIIRSSAKFTAVLDVTPVDVPLNTLDITTGYEYKFVYSQALEMWVISGDSMSYFTPNNNGPVIPEKPAFFVFYTIADADWVPEIFLPAKADNGSYIIVRSRAAYSSKVSTKNMLFASTTQIKKNDEYTFKFLSNFGGWVIDSAPVRTLRADSIDFQIPSLTSQHTQVEFSNGNWIEAIKLPAVAGDRDKVSLTSSANYTTTIDSSNVNMPGMMKLHTGERYDFFYIAENKQWQLMKYPDSIYYAKDIQNGNIMPLIRPRTIIKVGDSNWQPVLKLPLGQQYGSRVIFQSSATYPFQVLYDDKNYSVTQGEIVAFKVDEDTFWQKETITLNLLIVYSDKAADKLGEHVIRNRLIEAFNLTNEALENSGANFRFRLVGLKQIIAKKNWKTLSNVISELRDDPTVQGWRRDLKACGVYYEGTEDGCGMAYVKADSHSMIASGSINCGTTVMRHELGHNMGLKHAGESKSYNQGYGKINTIMGGNGIPYYSTPQRYTPDYGIRMGIRDGSGSPRNYRHKLKGGDSENGI